jgi:hypothetical protein
MNVLFIFLDGIGLGPDDPEINPFARADMPHLQQLLDGNRLVRSTSFPLETKQASLFSLDACLGVDGIPQSATGQATLLTGQNVPDILGYHYGPKPNPPVIQILNNGNIFNTLIQNNRSAALLNSYPQGYFDSIQSGRRIYSAIPLAVTISGIQLKNTDNLREGIAVSADFTAQGWHDHLGISDIPVISPREAGERMVELSNTYDLSLFEYWLSDIAGHRQDMDIACNLLETFDKVLGGLLIDWDDDFGLILITSDHGNMEDLSTRRHTKNPVPALLIGNPDQRNAFFNHQNSDHSKSRFNLMDIAPGILSTINS